MTCEVSSGSLLWMASNGDRFSSSSTSGFLFRQKFHRRWQLPQGQYYVCPFWSLYLISRVLLVKEFRLVPLLEYHVTAKAQVAVQAASSRGGGEKFKIETLRFALPFHLRDLPIFFGHQHTRNYLGTNDAVVISTT